MKTRSQQGRGNLQSPSLSIQFRHKWFHFFSHGRTVAVIGWRRQVRERLRGKNVVMMA
jgi:hypothetical protein